MAQRITVIVVIASLSSGYALAQTPSRRAEARVRVTGAEAYEIPGILKVEGRQVSGSSVRIDETTIQVVSPETGQPFVTVRPGARRIGNAIGVNGNIVTLILEGRAAPVDMPLSSIGKLELSEGKHGPHIFGGILAGTGTFFGVTVGIVGRLCGLRCSAAAIIPPIAAGIAVGTILGRSHESWKVVATDWLPSNIPGR